MNKQEELIKKYPKLFEYTWPAIGDGWIPLLDALCAQINHYINWKTKEGLVVVNIDNGEEPPEKEEWMNRVYFSQCKEKFGTARLYFYGGDDYIKGLVDMAEAASACICEVCGNHGVKRPMNWIKTLCDDCYAGPR